MTLPKEEADALRRIPAVLSKVSTPEERRNIALRIESRISGQDNSPLAYAFTHLAALFYPGEASKAHLVFQCLENAFDTGELVTRIPKEHRHVLLSDVAAWPACPAMSADSPLRYWLPYCPIEEPAPPNKGSKAVVMAEPESAISYGVTKKTTKNRDLLAPRIEDAQKRCGDRFDAPSVWAELKGMADSKAAPFIGVSEDGLKWEDGLFNVQFFTLKNLRDRLRTQKKNVSKG